MQRMQYWLFANPIHNKAANAPATAIEVLICFIRGCSGTSHFSVYWLRLEESLLAWITLTGVRARFSFSSGAGYFCWRRRLAYYIDTPTGLGRIDPEQGQGRQWSWLLIIVPCCEICVEAGEAFKPQWRWLNGGKKTLAGGRVAQCV